MRCLVNRNRADEVELLRCERNELLALCERKRYRLSRLPHLTKRLQHVTTALMKLELQETENLEPLGDAGAVGGETRQGWLYLED